jgi:hypothetical protein
VLVNSRTIASSLSTAVPGTALASRRSASLLSAIVRKTSTNSSAFEGKCLYRAPAATPPRSAIAATVAAA